MCGNDVPQSIIFAVSLLAFGCVRDSQSLSEEDADRIRQSTRNGIRPGVIWKPFSGSWSPVEGCTRSILNCEEPSHGQNSILVGGLGLKANNCSRCAYCIGAALHLPLTFPPPLFPNVNNFPLALLDEAQMRAWRAMKRFPKDSAFVFDIVVRLHQIGLATSSEWYHELDQQALSNLYFEALQSIMAIQEDEPWNAILPSGALGQETLIMFKVWIASLPIFVWSSIRHARTKLSPAVTRGSCRCEPVLSRIRTLLDGSGGHLAWPRGKSLEPILATLFYCAESCEYGDYWRLWSVDTLRKVIEMLKVKSVEEFRKILDASPSNDEYKTAVEEIWTEATQGTSASSTPSLTVSTMF